MPASEAHSTREARMEKVRVDTGAWAEHWYAKESGVATSNAANRHLSLRTRTVFSKPGGHS